MSSLENSVFATIAVFLIVACSQPPDQIAPAKNTSFYSSNEVATLTAPTTDNTPISIASFNIQFLGNSTRRDNFALASVVSPYDVVVVQELVSPPYSGSYPDGSPFKPDPQSAAFSDDMAALGYQYLMSAEDTGSGDKIHRNGSSTEWWVAFYRPGIVTPAEDLPHGFLAGDRSNHDDYERVPYAFGFRTTSGTLDFVLVSVHLKPGSRVIPPFLMGSASRATRPFSVS